MNDIFSSIYEFGGLLHFYASDLGDHLRGFDITCSNYVGTPLYVYIGVVMLLSTILAYLLHYHIIDSPRYSSKGSWWTTSLIISVFNFIFAFTVALNSVRPGNVCKDLHITINDIIGFGFANTLVSLILFLAITSIPYIRAYSTNCKYTTFWKP